MNWKKVEQRLRDASVEAVRAFARDHPAETFYGFCFDCNAEYGEVNLSLNTEDDLWAYAARVYPSKSLVSDHDETIADAWARLLRVRNRRR